MYYTFNGTTGATISNIETIEINAVSTKSTTNPYYQTQRTTTNDLEQIITPAGRDHLR
jgi:hypothetical protein